MTMPGTTCGVFIKERRVIPIVREMLPSIQSAKVTGASETSRDIALTLLAEYRNLYTTRWWRERISQAQRGQFPWTGRGRN
jgi:hypothetical protein